jgi:tetratricopeptide (TPR) repeat protein
MGHVSKDLLFMPDPFISKNHLRWHLDRLWLAVLLSLPLFPQLIQAELVDTNVLVRNAAITYRQTKAQYLAATNGSPAAWVFAAACYDLAGFATNDENRADLANEGIAACHRLLLVQPKSGAAHYYLGMNEGQLARTEYLGALKLVRDMEREFKLAWNLDKNVDHGGPARSLGLLYRDAPDWPTSIGSRRKAREWLERAAAYDPDFPENLVVLCESNLKWSELDKAAERLKQLDLIWPIGKTNLAGIDRDGDWADWTARREAIRTKIADGPARSAPSSPNSRRPE